MSITSTLVHDAEIRFHEPAEVLHPFVGCFWVVTADRRAAIRVVPDGTTSISIQLQEGRSSGWVLRGPLVRPEERRFESPATLVGVRLRPGVAFLLNGVPAHATVGRRFNLTAEGFRELAASDIAAQTPARYIDALQRFLTERLTSASVHATVARAVHEIEREHGLSRISDIAARCGVSARHLNRLMRRWVGYGPKCFAKVVRFQATLKEIDRSPAQTAARLASETGYFDQAHLTLALGQLAGDTPRRLATTSVSDFSKTRCEDAL
jgi:methylphosphotriester-DNA--protein-cysteine methyltransferase